MPYFWQTIRACTGILRGLACAHERAALHCDLEPTNILVSNDGTRRVMDFGIAQPIDRSNGSDGGNCPPRDAKATSRNLQPAFPAHLPMRPRKLRTARAPALPPSYSLAGIVLNEMLTGAPPIVSDNAYETKHRMAQDNFAPLSSCNGSDDHAAATVIGMPYAELGIGVAKHGNLPAPIIASMKFCNGEQISSSLYDHE